jgi:DNA polymerase-1
MSYIVIDAETEVICPIKGMEANPMWHTNDIVLLGFMRSSSELVHMHYTPTDTLLAGYRAEFLCVDMVVGHNIKFDLLHMYKNTTDVLPTIWDTQLAEYLLTGQVAQYASLDELTSKYVGKEALKDEEIKAHWKAGGKTRDIPLGKLLPYLRGDVENTHAIFKEQLELVHSMGMFPLVMSQMDALRATIAMNLAGMKVDYEFVNSQYALYSSKIIVQESVVEAIAGDLEIKSPKQLSLYFFGGKETVVERLPAGFYKNGKPKFKNTDVVKEHKGLYTAETWGFTKGANGYYSVDDTVLGKLAALSNKVAQCLLQLRTFYKIRDTYYAGLVELRFKDDYIYPQLNHCSTKTGRLSGNKPNLQNQTDVGDVKRAYVSRFGENGCILELDYSQLEMVALAFISNDKQLIDDINNGRDMHRELYKGMYGRYPTDAERKPFKRFSFLLVYGGGATTLMAQSGCDRATAKKFIDTFYKRYSGVKQYHEEIVATANRDRQVWYKEGEAGPQYRYVFTSPSKRQYIFNAYENEYKGGKTFSPTELKNWPIQGFATGDVVPMMVGLLQRRLDDMGVVQKQQAYMVMTVHDSVILDVHHDVLYDVASAAKEVLESAPDAIKKTFGITFPCKLSVGVDAGTNWQDTEAYEL